MKHLTFGAWQDYTFIRNELLYHGFQLTPNNESRLKRMCSRYSDEGRGFGVFALQVMPGSNNFYDFCGRLEEAMNARSS